MLKKALSFFCFALILGVSTYWYFTEQEHSPLLDEAQAVKEDFEKIQENPALLAEEALENPSAVTLLLKDFILSQGEEGITLWRLTAKAGNMSKVNNLFIVDKPTLVYTMDDGSKLSVNSVKGDVEQSQKKMRFIDNVHVQHNDQKLSGELLVYDGNEKTMTFPEQAFFKDSQVEGSANVVIWHIDSRLIEGQGNIHVVFESSDIMKSN